MSSFVHYAVLSKNTNVVYYIYDWDKMYCQIQNYIANQKSYRICNINLFQQDVSYYDEKAPISQDSMDILLSHNVHNFAFQKRKKYAYQYEYRFLLQKQFTENTFQNEKYLDIKIGSIESISKKVSAKEILISGISMVK